MILGRDHELKGEIYSQSVESSNVALGTSVGVTSKPNEDAIGLTTVGMEMILAIADGHWGREASEIAILKAMELISPEIRPARESETRARLFSLFEQVNSQLYEIGSAAQGALTPETTLIVCHIKRAESGTYLYWASFGDSFLFVLRSGQLRQINSLHPRWLGYFSKLSEGAESRANLMRFLTDESRYMGVASGLETGNEKLESGDIIFLCTDGLVGSDTAPDPSVLTGITQILTSDFPLDSKAENMIALALNRGEKDNITCGMASLP